MKKIEFTSLLETTLGPIEVTTTVTPWWLATLSFGIFRKVACRVSGPAFERENELRQEWAVRFHHNLAMRRLEKTGTFRTMAFRARFWHRHMVKYAKAIGEVLSDHHRIMQLFCSLQKAEENGNHKQALKIWKEIQRRDEEQCHNWRRLEEDNER